MQKACSETKINFDELKISGLTKNHLNYFYNLFQLPRGYLCLPAVCMYVCMYVCILLSFIKIFMNVAVNNCSIIVKGQSEIRN